MKLINTNVFGEQNIKFETNNYVANYHSPGQRVKLPIFMIHENHDDPTGLEYLSNLDVLSNTKHINYFGKAKNMECIEVKPILFK